MWQTDAIGLWNCDLGSLEQNDTCKCFRFQGPSEKVLQNLFLCCEACLKAEEGQFQHFL
jgi:hypothetical protein